jgi:hypothetical protein
MSIYEKLEQNSIDKNINKGAISIASYQQKELIERKKRINTQNNLKKKQLFRIDVKLLIKGIKFPKYRSSAIHSMQLVYKDGTTGIKISFQNHKNDFYIYSINVKQAVEWVNAESLGKYYNKYIKYGEFNYEEQTKGIKTTQI